MGKSDFSMIYRAAHNALGERPSIHVSSSSDRYDSGRNFAGIVVYNRNSSFTWCSMDGCDRGRTSRAFYFVIGDTSGWSAVHGQLYQKFFGLVDERGGTCCGGFAIMNGISKYNSGSFNITSCNVGSYQWHTDGQSCLSPSETLLVQQAIQAWKELGPGVVAPLSDQVHNTLGLDIASLGNEDLCIDGLLFGCSERPGRRTNGACSSVLTNKAIKKFDH
eukprot:365707-Chlamydomonas_euryale.AAC.38